MTPKALDQMARIFLHVSLWLIDHVVAPQMTGPFTTGGFAQMIGSFSPAQRWGTPEEISNAVVWLMSGDSSWVSGIDLEVSGGMTGGYMAPHEFIERFNRCVVTGVFFLIFITTVSTLPLFHFLLQLSEALRRHPNGDPHDRKK
jgi:hypothetical protein